MVNVTSSSLELVAGDGVRLFIGAEVPQSPKAAVILQHGIASHQAWYRPLAKILATAGYAVFVPDRRGAGRSLGVPCHMDHYQELTRDLQRLRLEIERRHPGLPLHAVGISLGAVMLLALELEHPSTFRSATLIAPGFAPKHPVPLLQRLRVLRRSVFDPTRLYPLPFGPRELTDNLAWREAIDRDPRRGAHVSARFLVQLFRLQSVVWNERAQLRTPLNLWLAGSDQVVDNRRAAELVAGTRSEVVCTDVFHGAPHMLPPARPKAELRDLLLGWLDQGHTQVGRQVVEHDAWTGPMDALPEPPVFGEVSA